jgi:hypothetical protein
MNNNPSEKQPGLPTEPLQPLRSNVHWSALPDEQQARWLRGERVLVEDLLREHATLDGNANPEALMELVYHEILLREQRGETCLLEEYLGRFPKLADPLRDQFEVHQALESSQLLPSPPFGESNFPLSSDRCNPVDGAAELPGRYTVVERVGHGGMGDVLRVRESGLNRDLALKVLRAEFAGRPDMVRRFVEEAQITGQLQHPAIVPVHELGTLPDGRPFFTMKLIKGQTLAELLSQRTSPEHDLPRYLGIFEQVCQALAYAHSRRVIHRDLKPANVMVGAFGEVQVMDWGLAKVLGREGRAGPDQGPWLPETTVVQTAPAGPSEQTQEGSVLGTLAYMAPEQALGERERIDERSDVFGLGAILCEILTGQPPFTGTAREMRVQAQLGHVQRAHDRLEACGVDAELIKLGQACLSALPESRPLHGGVVATAVQAHREKVQEKLRAAELEKATAQARTAAEQQARELAQGKAHEERRRRRLTVAVAALLVIAVAGLTIATVLIAGQ